MRAGIADKGAGADSRAVLTHRWVDGGSPAERAFLLAALKGRFHGGGGRGSTRAAPWATDRKSFLALVERERVGPLLHQALRGDDAVPEDIRAAFKHMYRLTALRNLLLARALERCLQALAEAGVAVIVLKGAALVESVYSNPALRPMVDVDLLVRRDDVSATRRVLESLGYATGRAETRAGVLSEYENELGFAKDEEIRVEIDLHWSLIDSPFYQERLAMDWFWRTARVLELGAVRTAMLGPEALLLHLCAHLALHHGGSGLIWWNDIAEVLRVHGDDIDWSEVVARAREFRLVLPLREVLSVLAAAWEVAVPAEVLARLEREMPTRREADLFARLGGGEAAGARLWTDLRSMSGWRRRLRFAATNLFPSPAYMRRRYAIGNRALLPVYYVYRWLRGGRDVAASLLRRRAPGAPGQEGAAPD